MSFKNEQLPLLPGFSFNPSIGKEYFGRKQHFSFIKNTCTLRDDIKITHRPQSLYCHGQIPNLPFWLLYDKQILTFYANFQNSLPCNVDGSNTRPVKIMYYLEDGTMKVIEPKTDNSGLCQGTIVGRQRIPLPGNEGHHIEIVDLNIGQEIEIYGKTFLIMSCDNFTKKFLNRLGIKVPEPIKYRKSEDKNFETLKPYNRLKSQLITTKQSPTEKLETSTKTLPVSNLTIDTSNNNYCRLKNIETTSPPEVLAESKKKLPSKTIIQHLPPWNGFGSHPDSAGNCNAIAPKAPRCDFSKFLYKDTLGSNSHILRFTAKLISDISDYDIRRFIISYYLKDDAISVFEMDLRNSGFQGGMFFKRSPVMLPEQDLYLTHTPDCYTIHDMWIGNVLTINNYRFLLIGADNYSLTYMEQQSYEFPKSNVNSIINKIRDRLLSIDNGFKDFVAKNIQNLYSANKSLILMQFFEKAIKEIAGDIMTQQEFITIARHFQIRKAENKQNREIIRSLVHTYISRNLWQDNLNLHKHFQYLDDDRSGFLSKHEVKQSLRANRLPIPDDLLNKMLDTIKVNDNSLLSYDDVMDFLNFKLKPVQQIIAYPAKSTKQTQKFMPTNLASDEKIFESDLVNWDEFVNHLNLQCTINKEI